MNFTIYHCLEIDAKKWSQCIAKQGSDVYNDYYYLQATTKQNWYGFIWGDYEKVLPYYQKKKYGILAYICMPFYVQKFDSRYLTEPELNEVMRYFKSKYWVIDYSVNDAKGIVGFNPKRNFVLDKNIRSLENLAAKFSSLVRKNSLKAKQYVDIVDTCPDNQIKNFLTHHSLFQRIYGQAPWLLDFPYSQAKAAIMKGTRELVAVVVYNLYHSKAYMIAPYTNELGKSTQAMTGLILSLLEDEKINIIDFEGSSIDSIAQFYAQFGAKEELYYTMNYRLWG